MDFTPIIEKIERKHEEISELYHEILKRRDIIREIEHEVKDLDKKIEQNISEMPISVPEISYSQDVQTAFNEEIDSITNMIFKQFKPKNYELRTKIEVHFFDQMVGFLIDKRTTYGSLSKDVGIYWGIDPSAVFFSDEPYTSTYPPVNSRRNNILKEHSYWGKCRLYTFNPVLHVVLKGYEDNSSYHKRFLPVKEEDPPLEPTHIHIKVPSPEVNKSQEAVLRRVRKNFLINMIQSVMLAGFTFLWIIVAMYEQDVFETSWMNNFLQVRLFGHQSPIDLSIYPHFPQGSFYSIHTAWDVWRYLIHKKHSFVGTGHVNEFSLIYQGLQIHQVRSNLHWCEIEDYGLSVCLKSHSSDRSFDDFSSKGEGFTYDDTDKDIILTGTVDWYNLDGFKVNLSIEDRSQWNTKISRLESGEWIDIQTRAVFVSFNVINPNIGVLTTVINLIEIGKEGNYALSYELASINYANLNIRFVYFHVFVLVWILFLGIVQFRNILLSKDEIVFVEIRTFDRLKNLLSGQSFEKELKKMLKKWEKHDKVPWFKRIRRPRPSEIVILSTIAVASVIEISYTFWYFRHMSDTTTEENKHTQLYHITKNNAILVDLKLLVVLALIALLCKSLIYYFAMLLEYYLTFYYYIKDGFQAIFLGYACIFVFSVVFYYTIGPFTQELTKFENNIFLLTGLAIGNMNIMGYVFEFVSKIEFMFLVVLYRFIAFLFITVFTSKLFMELSDNRNRQEGCK